VTKFRPTTQSDRELLEKYIAADEEHSKTSSVSFWLPPETEHKGVKYLAVEDEKGTIGFLVLENCLRIHAQFAPPDQTERTRAATADVMTQIKHWARPQYKEIVFESVSLGLIWFLRKFGFRRSKNEIVCRLQEQKCESAQK
jgi:hypothetical protein